MSEYEQIIDEIVKHGVAITVNKIVDDNYIPHERKYVGSVVKLDFSEHDKVFEDKIKNLENQIAYMKEKKNYLRTRCMEDATDAFDRGSYGALTIVGRRVDLEAENDKLKQKISDLESLMQKQDEFLEMKNIQIAELKQRIAELESKETSELPFDPLECANYLINATYERETSSLERGWKGLPEKVNSDRYTVDELEQIAEHLLVYCKHNKESE